MNGHQRVETEDMSFGTIRHQTWQEEAEKTSKLPECFGIDSPVDYIEHEFTTEIIKDVVIHSRPDVVSSTTHTIYDYKTILDGVNGWKANIKGYKDKSKQKQLVFYAYQLGLHGIKINQAKFLCEVWSTERDEIIGYEIVSFPITFHDMVAVLSWVKQRIALLISVLETENANA